jgi:anti-sigma regulatory factor (Ser/Thr protein kinase)
VARDALSHTLDAEGVHTNDMELGLLVSEIVTNAVVHARSDVHVTMDLVASRVHVEVGDDDPRTPAPRDEDQLVPGGLGLHILERLAADWGVRATPGGKVVWFEIVLDETAAPAPRHYAGNGAH